MSDLPNGWAETRLGNTISLNYGKSLPATVRDGGQYAVFGSNGIVGHHSEAITAAPAIIVGRKGSFGEVHFSEEACFPIDTTYYVDTFRTLDARFAFHLLRHLPLTEMNRASAIPGLNREDAYGLNIALPPIPEQRRIVEKVDGLTARTARARKELDRIPTLIARYKQRLLALAFSGELTAGWRKTNEAAPAQMMPLSRLCRSITDGDHQAPPRADDGIPFITISAMNDGNIDLGKASRFVPQSYYDGLKESRQAQVDDVLFSVTGSIGIPALVKDGAPFVFQRHIAIMKPDTQHISGEFLKFMLESPDVKAQCLAIATGTAQLTVPLSGLRNFIIPLPTKPEQAEIVRRIESAFGWLDRMATDHAAAARLLPKLDTAILTKAFQGKLVPQDPNDEPASKLLERVKAAREKSDAGPKRGRGRPRTQVIRPAFVDSDSEVFLPTIEVPKSTKPRKSAMTKSRQDDDVKDKPYLAGLLKSGRLSDAQSLFRAADLPVSDFYKQLAWEIDKGHILDNAEELKAA